MAFLSKNYADRVKKGEEDKLTIIVHYLQLFYQLHPFDVIPSVFLNIMLNRLLYQHNLPLSIVNDKLANSLLYSLDQAVAEVKQGQQRFLDLLERKPLRFY